MPSGADRFIPVRAKEDVVYVHDMLHRKADSQWNLTNSDYLRLRLDTAALDRKLKESGLTLHHHQLAVGIITIVAEKPQIAS